MFLDLIHFRCSRGKSLASLGDAGIFSVYTSALLPSPPLPSSLLHPSSIFILVMTISSPPLSLWEKLDLFAAQLSAAGAVLYSAVTGVFRGKSGAATYKLHLGNTLIRSLVGRLSARQLQYVC